MACHYDHLEEAVKEFLPMPKQGVQGPVYHSRGISEQDQQTMLDNNNHFSEVRLG